jgi:hypothetical protein
VRRYLRLRLVLWGIAVVAGTIIARLVDDRVSGSEAWTRDILRLAVASALPYLMYVFLIRSLNSSLVVGVLLGGLTIASQVSFTSNWPEHSTAGLGYLLILLFGPILVGFAAVLEWAGRKFAPPGQSNGPGVDREH